MSFSILWQSHAKLQYERAHAVKKKPHRFHGKRATLTFKDGRGELLTIANCEVLSDILLLGDSE